MSERAFTWDDDARVVVWPPEHPSPGIKGSLAYCILRAIEVSDSDPRPAKVEIEHETPGLIQMDEIRRMRADPTFPHDELGLEAMELGPMG
jgi:hypothetical protein